MRHSKLEPGWSAENVKAAFVLEIGVAGEVSIVVSGGTVSTVNVRDEAVSTLPAASTARTRIE